MTYPVTEIKNFAEAARSTVQSEEQAAKAIAAAHQLEAWLDELRNIMNQALNDMGEDGQGVTLETKKAMLRALGGEIDEEDEHVKETSEKIISAESLEWDRIS
jgi:DnaJ-domain-containing protein 1